VSADWEQAMRDRVVLIPDHPKPGVTFYDVTPLWRDADCFRTAVDLLAGWAEAKQPDVLVAVDARGFVLGGAVAASLGCGFVPLRKRGKLPRARSAVEFDCEYSTEVLELHDDAFAPGTRVVIHDDVIAVGNCSRASIELVEGLGGEVVGLEFLLELSFLGGRKRVDDWEVFSVLTY
jgi:adenine phosphoribosyltransferase